MVSDDELRDKLTKALIDNRCCGGRTARGEAMRSAYYLMPVVRDALAQAWDDGHAMATDEFVHSDYCGRVCQCEGIAGGKNPWREDD